MDASASIHSLPGKRHSNDVCAGDTRLERVCRDAHAIFGGDSSTILAAVLYMGRRELATAPHRITSAHHWVREYTVARGVATPELPDAEFAAAAVAGCSPVEIMAITTAHSILRATGNAYNRAINDRTLSCGFAELWVQPDGHEDRLPTRPVAIGVGGDIEHVEAQLRLHLTDALIDGDRIRVCNTRTYRDAATRNDYTTTFILGTCDYISSLVIEVTGSYTWFAMDDIRKQLYTTIPTSPFHWHMQVQQPTLRIDGHAVVCVQGQEEAITMPAFAQTRHTTMQVTSVLAGNGLYPANVDPLHRPALACTRKETTAWFASRESGGSRHKGYTPVISTGVFSRLRYIAQRPATSTIACIVCTEPLNAGLRPVILNTCGHLVHMLCLVTWLRTHADSRAEDSGRPLLSNLCMGCLQCQDSTASAHAILCPMEENPIQPWKVAIDQWILRLAKRAMISGDPPYKITFINFSRWGGREQDDVHTPPIDSEFDREWCDINGYDGHMSMTHLGRLYCCTEELACTRPLTTQKCIAQSDALVVMCGQPLSAKRRQLLGQLISTRKGLDMQVLVVMAPTIREMMLSVVDAATVDAYLAGKQLERYVDTRYLDDELRDGTPHADYLQMVDGYREYYNGDIDEQHPVHNSGAAAAADDDDDDDDEEEEEEGEEEV